MEELDGGISIPRGIKGIVSDVAGMVLVRRNGEPTGAKTSLVTLL